jgi:peptide methionine sulfoxide reductase MsrB
MANTAKPDDAELRARLTPEQCYCINSASLDFSPNTK